MVKKFAGRMAVLILSGSLAAANPAAEAVNALGVELLGRATRPGENTAISPLSIQTALVMTYAGAAGETREQMARVLHLPPEAVPAFSALQKQVAAAPEAVTLQMANRLFGQTGYAFRPDYLALTKKYFGAPLEPLDFTRNPEKAAQIINAWVEKQTRDRIRDLIPPGALSRETALVLVNALYFKAPWSDSFETNATTPQPFHFADGKKADVSTMFREASLGYKKANGFTAVTIPYSGGDLQFLVLLPDPKEKLSALEKQLTPRLLADCANLPRRDVRLFLPKFKLEPPRFQLGEILREMGMTHAFDIPERSANFDGIAPRRPNDYLYLSDVFHKTFVEVNEAGTEAAAATAVVMFRALALPVPEETPVEVRVDRPFLFAIQHRPSGACLFLGRVTDPR